MPWKNKRNTTQILLCDTEAWLAGYGSHALMDTGKQISTTSTTTVALESGGITRLRTFSISMSTLSMSVDEANQGLAYFFGCRGTDPTLVSTADAAGQCASGRISYLESGYSDLADGTSSYSSFDPELRPVADFVESATCGSEIAYDAASDSFSYTEPTTTCCPATPNDSIFGNVPAKSTSIPDTKRACFEGRKKWSVDYIVGFAPGTFANDPAERPLTPTRYGTATVFSTSEYMAVRYKDPHVIQGPDGRWFMFLARLRVPERYLGTPDPLPEDADCTNATSCPPAPGVNQVEYVDDDGRRIFVGLQSPGHGSSLGDIVMYWSDNPEFDADTGMVKGPFLVVDSLDAVPEVDVRFWVGVPGATFVTEGSRTYLLVYYIAEGNYVNYASTPDQQGVFYDEMTYDEYQDALVNGTVTTTDNYFQAWIYCKRISFTALDQHIGRPVYNFAGKLVSALGTGSTDESTWTKDDAIPGELLGRVRFWAVNPNDIYDSFASGATNPVRRLEEDWKWTWETSSGDFEEVPKTADPCPVACSDGRLALFFSVAVSDHVFSLGGTDPGSVAGGAVQQNNTSPSVPRPGTHGIWHAMGLPTDAHIEELVEYRVGSSRALWWTQVDDVTLGRDFVVNMQTDPSSGLYKDQLYRSTGIGDEQGTGQPSDPDALLVDDGNTTSWRVYFTGINLVVGDLEDGCYDWATAWDQIPVVVDGDNWAAIASKSGRKGGVDPDEERVYAHLPWLAPDWHASGKGSPVRASTGDKETTCGCGCVSC